MENQRKCPPVTRLSPQARDNAVNELLTGMTPVQQKAVADCPVMYRLQYARALKYGKSALKLKCMECVGFEDVKERVGGCTVSRCPLWSSRPFQKGRDE